MKNNMLEQLINKKLKTYRLNDYTPNGLQVEGRENVKNIITGVTACQLLLNEAVSCNADAIIVHHGYFWKNEPIIIKDIKRIRLKTLLTHDINLYAWHLPLDVDPILGNNVQLAKILHIKILGYLHPLLLKGKLLIPMDSKKLHLHIEKNIGRNVIYCGNDDSKKIKYIAWCTGKGQEFISLAAKHGMDAFITGEASENTIHIARENNINFYSAGHHATERGGIKALGNWLSKKYNFNVTFIDINNPI